jgi:hypothetical protein
MGRLVCLGLSLAVAVAALLALAVVFSRGATDRAERRDCTGLLYAVDRLDGVCPQGAVGTWRAR